MSSGVSEQSSRQRWLCIDTGERDGKFNMDYDLHLVDEAKLTGTPVLRFYRWRPYCLSLGKNQDDSEINSILAKENQVNVVRRPTGGKAVLHAEELTYSVVMNTKETSLRESYNMISRALAEGLRKIGADVELSEGSADFRKLFRDPSTIPCFSTSAAYEVEWHGRKLIGSAQHRFGDILLQHGSILIGNFHKEIVRYLRISEELKQKTQEDLEKHTVTLTDILKRETGAEEIMGGIKKGFENIFNANFSEGIIKNTGSVDVPLSVAIKWCL